MAWPLISPMKVTPLGFTAGTKPTLETGNDMKAGREMPPLPVGFQRAPHPHPTAIKREPLFQPFPALRPLSQASSQEG